jgi:hypothetical protein
VTTSGYVQLLAEKRTMGKRDGYQSCGAFYLWYRKYRLTTPVGEVMLTVLGSRVWISYHKKTASHLFRGVSPEAALTKLQNILRPYLEPTGDLA